MPRVLIALLLLLSASFALAEGGDDPAIPAALRDWRGWVLHDLDYRACPFLATQAPGARSAHVCAWPGRLQLDAQADGAGFSQRWRVEAADWVPLPGDSENWPQDVTVDGKPVPVLLHDNAPQVWLAAGSVEIRGRIPWAQRPQQLRVPATIGLVALRVDGRAVEPLERSGEELTLGRGEAAQPEADALNLLVFRRLEDGVPAALATRIEIGVAGQAREETFGPVLPEGFVPLSLQGELPARLDPDGKLHVQVQPGSWTLTLNARATAPLARVAARLAPSPWPTQEIWSYASAAALRVTSASAATPIDPAQAGVPDDWRALPAFTLGDGDELTVEERSRGLAADEANRLSLTREAWLDFSGASLYAKDRIGGKMQRGWRLDVAAPYRLERAEADGQGLLVTRRGTGESSGVELRNPQVNLAAGLRVDAAGGRLPIAGWAQDFDSVNLNLHLPYGYRLLGAPGADVAAGSWMSRWTLLDVFVVALAGLLAWRLLGLGGGALALGYLVLSYHEPAAPRWALVLTLALALLLKALPAGKLQGAARLLARAFLLSLLLITLPFLADQVRYALYPQLEPGSVAYAYGPQTGGLATPQAMDEMRQNQMADMAPPEPAAPPAQATPKPAARAKGRATTTSGENERLESVVVTGSRISQGDLIANRYAKNATIQAGRGEPGWQYGSSYALSWSGPVLAAQSMRLVIAPPWLTRLLRVVMLGLLALTAAQLARRLFGAESSGGSPARWRSGSAAALACLGLIAAGALPAARAADLPDAGLLSQLRERLLPAPKCAPACASVARAEVRASGDALRVALDVAVGERVALPLPEGGANLALDAVRVDGSANDSLAREQDLAWLAVARGVHRIELEFRVIDTDHLALKFPLKPARVALSLDGWLAGGAAQQRLLGDTLTLTRERRETNAATPGRAVAQQFPPYVAVQRSLLLDLEWSVSATVRRLAPAQGGFATRVALLPGEQVQSAGTKQEDGQVLLSFGADEEALSWAGRLERADTLSLTAPPMAERAEVWRITVSPMWHVEFAGVPEVLSSESDGSYWTHEFHPLPGETLSLRVSRPEAVEGKSFAIDSVTLAGSAGTRAFDATLQLGLRSTQGGEHVIALPADAEVLSVAKNGQVLNLRPRDGKLSLPLTPGAQRFDIGLRLPHELGTVTRLPAFGLGAPAANVALDLTLPGDRWVLFAFGPAVGPAVLYWGELVVMVLVAWGLARLRRTPLKLWHWLLLGFGFSTFSWGALLLVAAWLFALDWRGRWQGTKNDGVFNLAQIALALLTVLALFCLVASVPYGLLGQPDMHITGNGSSAQQLRWFADQAADALPVAGAVTLPRWVYQFSMLAWAMWLANALIGWLRWGFGAWTAGGYWRSAPPKAAATSAATAPTSAPPPDA